MFLINSDVRAWSALFAVMLITVTLVFISGLSQRTIPVESANLSRVRAITTDHD
jgi:hypothetical protein